MHIVISTLFYVLFVICIKYKFSTVKYNFIIILNWIALIEYFYFNYQMLLIIAYISWLKNKNWKFISCGYYLKSRENSIQIYLKNCLKKSGVKYRSVDKKCSQRLYSLHWNSNSHENLLMKIESLENILLYSINKLSAWVDDGYTFIRI